jgi:hypothetical protein
MPFSYICARFISEGLKPCSAARVYHLMASSYFRSRSSCAARLCCARGSPFSACSLGLGARYMTPMRPRMSATSAFASGLSFATPTPL